MAIDRAITLTNAIKEAASRTFFKRGYRIFIG